MIWHKELTNIGTTDIGEDTIIHSHTWIGKDVKIGKRCKIQAFVFIPDGVEIEDDVFIAPHTCFTNDPALTCKGKDFWQKTIVRQGAKIGAGAMPYCLAESVALAVMVSVVVAAAGL